MKKSLLKKATALLAVAAMSASLLAGCASGEQGNTSSGEASSQPGSSVADSSVGSEQTPQENEHPSWVSETPIEVRIMLMDNANQPLANDTPAHDEIFNKTNVRIKLEIVPQSSYDDKKNIALSTNNFPDIVYLRSYTDITDYADEGIFEPLSQYINEETMPNFYKFWQQYPEMQRYMVDGEMYVFPGIAREETANGTGPVIRTDLLEENNIPIPNTFDELLEALAKLKEIYPDSVPWACRQGTGQLLKTTAYMLGCGHGDNGRGQGMYWDADKGQYVYGPAAEEFKAVLTYLNKAYEMGVLDPEYATTDANSMATNASSGKSFFFLDNSGFGQNYTNELRKIEGLENATFQVIPIPENSFGQRRAVAFGTTFGKLFAVNAKAENKEELIKFTDWMYSQEGSDITNYGVEGLSFQYNAEGEPEFIPEYIMQFKDASPSDYYAVYSNLGITKLDWCLWACNTKTQFEIQKITGSWTEVSDEYWEIIAADEAYVQPHMSPSFTAEESERISEITTDLDTFFAQEYDKYIMGNADIADWDKLIQKAEEKGVRELEQIWNDAEARAAAALQ